MPTRAARHALALFCAVYLLAVFPWAFFRHDDWLILGNAVNHLPRDWGFLWRSTLFFHGQEGDWFFRPFFKLGTYVFFRLFHFHYYFWLTALLACQASAVALAHATLRALGASPRRAALFVIAFTASVHLHFANAVWMGEGMMNSPQLLVLTIALYAFVRDLLAAEGRLAWRCLSTTAFAISLGFKESSLVLPALLGAIALSERMARAQTVHRRFMALLPHALVAGAYTAWRFLSTPLNGSYRPRFADLFSVASLGLIAALAAPVALTVGLAYFRKADSARAYLGGLRRRFFYAPFLLLLVAPYLAHPFFSPGWLLLPGFFLLFVFCLIDVAEADSFALWPIGLAVFLVGATPVAYQTARLGWWQWRLPQQEFFERLRQASGDTKVIRLSECGNERYPDSSLTRVVGFRDGMEETWEILHGNRVPFEIRGCEPDSREPSSADTLVLHFRFPELSSR